MQISFQKMHGLGNDFVILDGRKHAISLTEAQIQILCDRHRGVGCDQLVLIEESVAADVKVLFYNADGSFSSTCGNASRCVASLMAAELDKKEIALETTAGLVKCKEVGQNEIVVDMGAPIFGWQMIPLAEECDPLHLDINLEELRDPVALSMGNPHCVFFVDDVQAINIHALGPKIEHHPIFPERSNVELVQIHNENHLALLVWERGAGITLACGSGACAAVVAAHQRGLVGKEVAVDLPGGRLTIRLLENGHVEMQGPVSYVFSGTVAEVLL